MSVESWVYLQPRNCQDFFFLFRVRDFFSQITKIPPDKEGDDNRHQPKTSSQTCCFLTAGSIQWLPVKELLLVKSSHISIELLLGKPGSSFVELEFGSLPATFKKRSHSVNIKGSNSILSSVIATHGGHKVEGRKEKPLTTRAAPQRGFEKAGGDVWARCRCWAAPRSSTSVGTHRCQELEATVPTPACRSRARSSSAAQIPSLQHPHGKEGCASWLWAGSALPQVVSVVSLLCQMSAQCRCKKPGWGVATGGFCPFPRAPHPWCCCCEMVPRKRRTEPKVQLSWCPVALASTVTACHRTPSIQSSENSRSFPFLHKMIYSSLSYGKETMRKGDQVCQEQRIPFISVFSLTRKKCIIITEGS